MTELEYWQKYLYFTRELKKFLLSEEWDVFNQLLEERQKMQEEVGAPPSAEIRTAIEGLEQEMKVLLQQKIYQMKQSQQVSRAYDSMGQEDAGRWMDSKR